MKIAGNKPLKPTALRLMAVAEQLIGEHGYDNVSLVEIARSAGQANKYAVQYHFGSKENLVRTIFDHRLARIGARRRKLLDGIKERDELTVGNLIHAFIYPVYLEVDEHGRHSYARFAERMLDTAVAGDVWFKSNHFSTTIEVRELLMTLSPLAAHDFAIRYRLVSGMLIQALATIDRSVRGAANLPDGKSLTGTEAEILEAAIAIACLALENPLQTQG